MRHTVSCWVVMSTWINGFPPFWWRNIMNGQRSWDQCMSFHYGVTDLCAQYYPLIMVRVVFKLLMIPSRILVDLAFIHCQMEKVCFYTLARCLTVILKCLREIAICLWDGKPATSANILTFLCGFRRSACNSRRKLIGWRAKVVR